MFETGVHEVYSFNKYFDAIPQDNKDTGVISGAATSTKCLMTRTAIGDTLTNIDTKPSS
jgi:hypothetical protein